MGRWSRGAPQAANPANHVAASVTRTVNGNVPVAVGNQTPEALEVLLEHAARTRAPLLLRVLHVVLLTPPLPLGLCDP